MQRPSYLNPFRYPERAKARRDTVLRAMAEQGNLTAAEPDEALQPPLGVVEGDFDAQRAPHFVDLVRREIKAHPDWSAAIAKGGKGEEGFVTVREAMVRCLKGPTVRIAKHLGYQRVAELARKAGMTAMGATPSAALETYEVWLLELAGADDDVWSPASPIACSAWSGSDLTTTPTCRSTAAGGDRDATRRDPRKRRPVSDSRRRIASEPPPRPLYTDRLCRNPHAVKL